MAEVLGAVASAFAVAEVAVKAGSVIVRLRSLWAEVRDVPETIRDLMREIEILDPLLSEMEGQLLGSGASTSDGTAASAPLSRLIFNDTAARLSAEYCRVALCDLRALVEDLSLQIEASRRSRRGAAKVKVALKKETLVRLQGKLHRAVRLLNSAQLGYLTALVKLQPDIIVGKLREDVPPRLRLDDIDSSTPKCDGTTQETVTSAMPPQFRDWQLILPPTKPSFLGSVKVVSADPEASGRIGKYFASRVQLPKWLLAATWELHAAKAMSGWQFNLRHYGLRPTDASVFKYASQGDLDGLRSLFSRGETSPFDFDPYGQTALFYAAFNCRVEVMKSLLGWGLRANYVTLLAFGGRPNYSRNRLHFSGLIDLMAFQDLNRCGMFNILEDICKNSGIETVWNYLNTALHDTDILQEAIRTFYPSFFEIPLKRRVLLLFRPEIFGANPNTARLLLSHDGDIQRHCFRSIITKFEFAPHSIAMLYGQYFMTELQFEDSRLCFLWDPSWLAQGRRLMCDIIQSIDDLHAPVRFNCNTGGYWQLNDSMFRDEGVLFSPMFAFLRGVCSPRSYRRYYWRSSRRWATTLSKSLRLLWLQDLSSCGVDLCQYGKRELAFFRRSDDLRWVRWSKFIWENPPIVGPRLVGFNFGARPEDWSFEWDMDFEEFAGEFWELIEDPVLHVPGAWVDDDP